MYILTVAFIMITDIYFYVLKYENCVNLRKNETENNFLTVITASNNWLVEFEVLTIISDFI